MNTAVKLLAFATIGWFSLNIGCAVDTDAELMDEEEIGQSAAEMQIYPCPDFCKRFHPDENQYLCTFKCLRDRMARRCKTDRDCRLHSNYCGTCSCESYNKRSIIPKCDEELMYCFADPCMGEEPMCLQGRCTTAF